ncbi:tRNA uridine(34) 5-carboxymethylaminomethyl modification radical SAM/GNAT enzyme Elp3 [Candidatus Woesearchaeota archaeon CG10_big_fil_rev_8_21_14_0_10_44_13]|nr:MAG: tRNA uridine(34) 5-carboxymethylaminomethyl modification radical SAM/GNAT enzyme Elp3 [Candidatus Woesearchaeota archaeon CG10_big_fil_rev_8_21_14_0_10_44_13]
MKKSFYTELIAELRKKRYPKEGIAKLKRKLAKKYSMPDFPTDIEIFLNAGPSDIRYLRQLQTKPTRSLSGVAVIAVMTKPMKCPHGKCAICPGGPSSVFGEVPQSYTGKEPATMRAMRAGFDPYLQVFNRLEQYIVSGHVPDKVELIIMGGTFPSFPKEYREEFVKYCFKAMNDFSRMFFTGRKETLDILNFRGFFELPGEVGSKERTESVQAKLRRMKGRTILEKEQKKNEDAKIRCIGMTIETRPDYATLEHANEMLRLGCTRVELGVQSVYDDVLEKIGRGHKAEDSVKATEVLKDLGFKINYHYMIGLPGSNPTKDLVGLSRLFVDPDFKPDMLKIYPCMVVKGTKLYDEWKEKRFVPLKTSDAAEIIIDFKKNIPKYVRIMRVQRDIPTYMTEAGVDRTNLRQMIHEEMKKRELKCNCIRCREAGRSEKTAGKNKKVLKTDILAYNASKGVEFFISENRGDALLGFCRLRIPHRQLRKEITWDSALLRELHVYGETAAIGEDMAAGKGKDEEGRYGKIQHKGIGKKLLKKAEQIAKQNKMRKMVVISGVGARGYYRRLGYKLEGPYMVKRL